MSFLTRLSLANRAVITLLCLLVIGTGVYATTALKQELIPSTQFPQAFITAAYPGASPEVVERNVAKPVEDAVRGVSGVTKSTSTSASGMAQVTVEWDFGIDSDEMQGDLEAAVDALQLPEDVEPQVTTISLDAAPVLSLAVSSDLDNAKLSQALDDVVVPRLQGLPDVSGVQVGGQEEREVLVTLRQADLDKYEVDPSQISQIFEAYGAKIPAGELDEGSRQVNVQVGKTLNSAKDVGELRLQGTDGPVTLSQVADVKDQAAESTGVSRVNGRPSLSLNVTKTTEGNTVAVANEVKDLLPALAAEIGENTTFDVLFDQAPYIEDSIHDLSTEGMLGLVMAVIVILLFLWSVRPTLITAISIPMSLLIAMIGLWVGGYSLNMLTLGALTVAIGRVVDDSIVVIENIKRHQSTGAPFNAELIIKAVKEVAGAVTASTLTTAAVFLPIALVGGQVGELFRPFAVTVAVALMASLLVSLTIVPVLSSWFMKPSRRPVNPEKQAAREAKAEALAAKEHERHAREAQRGEERLQAKQDKLQEKYEGRGYDQDRIDEKLAAFRAKHVGETDLPPDHDAHESAETPMQRGYLPVLRWTLRHPLITIVAALLIFVLTMGMSSFLKTDFLGDQGDESLQVTQTLPKGTTLEATDEASKKVETVLDNDASVQTYQTSIGGSQDIYMGAGGSTNVATFTITLVPDSAGNEVMQRLRDQLAGLSDDAGEIEVMLAGGATGGEEVAVQVEGQDEQAVAEGTRQVVEMMEGQAGLTQVKSDLAEQQTIFQVDVDEKKAAEAGMNQATIGMAVSEALRGTDLGTIQIDGRDQKVTLRSRTPVKTKSELENMELPVTQKQTGDAQKRASDDLEREQDAEAERQKADAEEQAEEQKQALRDQRAELADQLQEMIDQLEAARNAPPPTMPSMPPGQAPPTDPGAGQQAQVEQLEEQVKQLREQLEQMDEQIADSEEQEAKQREQQERSEDLQERSKNISDIKADPLKLKDVAKVNEVDQPASISRIDGARAVTVSATPTGDNLSQTTLDLQNGLTQLDLPSGVSANIGGVSQQQDEAFGQLFLAMAVAIAIVYMIMVATFKSLVQPLILLVSVPFAATGAIAALLITDTALGIPSMIGLLMLIGIVVTNAIVLIDLINHYRGQGASVDDAVVHGARLRLRPIIMTAAATIMALIPMGLGLTGGGVFISKPLAVVVIGGLVSSTLLTLLLVPVLYHLLERGREKRAAVRAHRAGAHHAAGA
ncbi:efflux RND transporter permease subunit [Propionibacteriaceae bacterium Y1685]